MDLGAGVVFSDGSSGFAVDLRVQTLRHHQAERFRERDLSVAVSYNPRPSAPLGFSAQVTPYWGRNTNGGDEALWGQETMGSLGGDMTAGGNRFDAETGQGLPLGDRGAGAQRAAATDRRRRRAARTGRLRDRGRRRSRQAAAGQAIVRW